jgi:hypothetical protein
VSGFVVLGSPDPLIADAYRRYRGVSRDAPSVVEGLGLDHPANATLLEILEHHDVTGPIDDLEVVRRLAAAYAGREIPDGPYEIVERTSEGERPRAVSLLLGWDVAFEGGGSTSLLATILLYGELALQEDDRVLRLRREFVGSLNEHCLFEDEADARAFLVAANEIGPWEGPDINWEVVGVWLVPAPRSGPEQPIAPVPDARAEANH